MDKIDSPITTIPGISLRIGAMIIAEIGDFNNFDSTDKILAFAGLSPFTYQSGQLNNCYVHMEKRGSRYLRYALFNAAKLVCNWNACDAFLSKINLSENTNNKKSNTSLIVQYICDNHTKNITLKDISELLGYDYNYVSR